MGGLLFPLAGLNFLPSVQSCLSRLPRSFGKWYWGSSGRWYWDESCPKTKQKLLNL